MLIFRINNNSQTKTIDDGTKKELSIHGIDIMGIEASSMSFVTTMRIATACKKITPDLVIADTKNIFAAIHARVLSRKRGQEYPIALRVTNTDKVPQSILKDIRTGTDIWLFDHETTQTTWKNIIKGENCQVIGNPLHVLHVEHSTKTNTIIYAGELDKCERLAVFITALANVDAEQRPTVRVCGTGKARYVMPVVKRARAMSLDVQWLGNEYNISDEIRNASGFILSDNPYSTDEIRALACGIPQVSAENLLEWLDPEKRKTMSANATETYQNNHEAKSVAKRLSEIINKYRK